MKIALDFLLYFIKASSYQYAARRMKRKGLIIYLKVLQVSRKSLLAVFILAFIFQLMVLGFVGATIAGVLLLPEDLTTKIWILFGIFSVLFVVPALFLMIALSEKTWFKVGKVQDLLSEIES